MQPNDILPVTRRNFLGAAVSATAVSSLLGAIAPAATPKPDTTSQPPLEIIALNRMAYGPRPGDVERVRKIGFKEYVEEQLNPSDKDDAACVAKLKAARLRIEYGESEPEPGKKIPARNEDRPLTCLDKSSDELWKLASGQMMMDYQERTRPLEEVRAATWIRAVHSKYQLHEVLAEFWHNHFNVNVAVEDKIATLFPVYDRDVIRKNALGNFRQFLEDVAQSAAMLYYLNNASSRASPANENYARELFELHTLGAPNYFNHLYSRWREVPGATDGKPTGYIDQDVYEAARAFTGWTIADGTDSGRGDTFPNTGRFHYYEGWHDNYQKRVLGAEFDPNQPPLADGRRVLDLVAFHPATAHYVCAKLCRRLVADEPPEALVKRAAETWTATKDKPDQIKQTVRAILLSPEFAATWGQKVKRPFELIASFLRATDAEVTPNSSLTDWLTQMGYRHFEWPTPTGHPDTASHWLGTNVMLLRWNLLLDMFSENVSAAKFKLREQMPANVKSCEQIVKFWSDRMLGSAVSPTIHQALLNFATQGLNPDDPPGEAQDEITSRVNQVVALVGMTPEFQMR